MSEQAFEGNFRREARSELVSDSERKTAPNTEAVNNERETIQAYLNAISFDDEIRENERDYRVKEIIKTKEDLMSGKLSRNLSLGLAIFNTSVCFMEVYLINIASHKFAVAGISVALLINAVCAIGTSLDAFGYNKEVQENQERLSDLEFEKIRDGLRTY